MVPIRNQTSDFVILCSDAPPLSDRKLCSEANHYQVSLVGRDRVKVREQMIRISNGNWTEWTAIWFEIILVKWVHSTSLIWNHKYDFRPKLHNRKFNHHFITSILKSQTSVAQVQDFCSLYKCFVDPVMSWFVETWLVSLNKQLVVVL